MKKFLALLLAAMMLLGMTSAFAEATDTITVMVPPVTGTYLDDIDTWANDFMAEHPEIKVEVIKTSWDDHNSKLNTMANAGEAPDIAEVSYSAIGTYVELGLGVEIDQYMDAERLADYDQNALDYMSLDGHVYGLPLYITIQALTWPRCRPKAGPMTSSWRPSRTAPPRTASASCSPTAA